ncbi:MAG: ABC transporter ATP-binding protein [Candidatus Staskawiczbacteria bacterium]|nr:ABC transporter ATP-binding protein [Candidatus Staskawiczbacteria bacterium]
MTEPIIKVENLSKRYWISHEKGPSYATLRDELVKIVQKPAEWIMGKKSEKEHIWALKDVNFSVNSGEIVGVIGANGAGKSTLLKVLTRITPPSDGRVALRGRVGSLLEVGTGFHPELTGRENIYLNGAILGMSRKEISSKFSEIVQFSGVEKFLDTPLKRYSSGMNVRLAFSVAAHLEPEILLIDEVLAVGDVAFQKKSMSKMEEVSKKGRTILFVSHNMASVVNLCKRTILLDGGKIVMDGPTSEVIEYYMGLKENKIAEVVWSNLDLAPGNEEAKLHKVRILSDDGRPISEADIQKETQIEMSYWNLKEGAKLFVSMHLISSQGITVLTTFNAPSVSLTKDEWYDKEKPKGLFKSICKIPANFLNEGMYFISVFITSYDGMMINHAVKEKVISFNVVDTGGMRKEYSGPWVGVVRPRLSWSTEYEGNK